MNKRGQFTIIAALLVAVVLIAAVISTYSAIRYSPLQEQPQVLNAIDEINLALKQILGFTVGYYGSVLKVTGNTSYAQNLATNYLCSGLSNIGDIRPEWGVAFNVAELDLSANWFSNVSYSKGSVTVKYNLTGLGIYGISYSASSRLDVNISKSNSTQASLTIFKDENEPLVNLGKRNLKFYNYSYADSTWQLVEPTNLISYPNGTYSIDLPSPITGDAYVLQVEDPRGIIVTASSFTRYSSTVAWNENYSTIPDENILVELLQNGTIRWLGQNLNLTSAMKPIPPIPVKSIHVNQTINGVNQEVPFQVEDWASEYRIPLGMSSNTTVFSNRQMIVFLMNNQTSKFTIWWNGSDEAIQTPLASTPRFTQDDINNGILSNGNLKLISNSSTYLYVDGFDSSSTSWTESGSSPYLNNNQNNYIYHNGDNQREGWFSFQDLPTEFSQLFASTNQALGATVNIDFECTRQSNNDYFEFRITDGTTTYGPYRIDPPNDGNYGWRSYDVSDIINTLGRLNNAKIEVTYRQSGSGASNVYIRQARLSLNFWLTSISGNSTTKADLMRINTEKSVYGASPAFVIHHGIVRDILQQEAEWSGGADGCPNLYANIVLTLPANVTYYTYQLRLMFINSTQSRTITDLCPISIYSSSISQIQTENGTLGGLPQPVITLSSFNNFYNFSDGKWQHHWSQLISGTSGTGIMFTDTANQKLYTFDSIAGTRTGALKADSSNHRIELLPVTSSTSFQNALDVTWQGAVVTFDGTASIYQTSNGGGLWVLVEYPPTITVTAET
ncbi:MAG: hypothetical protein NWE99_00700 [Candidatus Bathyarchaeota archaeon]|nr:hypothetical protein [Candidatus Bathyarchaeota archaeon]